MTKRGHSEEEILRVQSGTTVVKSAGSMASAIGVFVFGRRSIRGLGLSELRELMQLREENRKLKRLVADHG
jgi:hypothetical protein